MPTTEKHPLKVFLCHASTDKPKVRELYHFLKGLGINPWFDEEDLVGGQKWQDEIPKAIRASDVVIVCLTENSINREGYIQKEIKYALDIADEKPEGTIFIIPVRLDECQVPDRLSIYHWVNLFDREYSKLLGALKVRSAQLGRVMTDLSIFSFKEIQPPNRLNIKKESVLNRDYLARRVSEELAVDGLDSFDVWKMSENGIRDLVSKIARRLGENFERVWDALVKLGDW